MFFKKERLTPVLFDVVHIQQQNTKSSNRNRAFHALSFRFHSNAILDTERAQYRLTDNTLTFMPAFQDYTRTADVEDMIVVLFYLDGLYFQEIETFIPKNPTRYADLFKQILERWTAKQSGYLYQCSATLYEILALAYAEQRAKHPFDCDEKIRAGVTHLLNHFQNPNLSVTHLAKECFISEVYFRKLFRQSFGVSPKKYLMHLRLDHAKKLLQMGYYSLQEVATLSGFSDYKYFSVEFKRVHGISPSRF